MPNPEKYNPHEQEQAPEISAELQPQPERLALEWEPRTEEEKTAQAIVRCLQTGGEEAYFVGGFPRDLAMAALPEQYPDTPNKSHDLDIATSLTYEKAKKTLAENGFSNFKETGQNFKVLNVIIEINGKNTEFEIATFRTENDYGDGRKPAVQETSSAGKDAARRDFTINALYMDPVKKKLVDYVGGIKDIKDGTLRTVGDPYERMVVEDPIRMLRYVRFRAKYNMKFDTNIKTIMQDNGEILADSKKISAERVKEELEKIFKAPRAAFAIADLARLGLLKQILPEVANLIDIEHTPPNEQAEIHQEGSVYKHTLQTMRAADRPEFVEQMSNKLGLGDNAKRSDIWENFLKKYGPSWQWANLLHDTGKADTQTEGERAGKAVYRFFGHEQESLRRLDTISKRLRFSKAEKEETAFLIKNHMKAHKIGDPENEMKSTTKAELFRNPGIEPLLFLSLADDLGTYAEGRERTEKIERFERAWQELQGFRAQEIKRQNQGASEKEISQVIAQTVFRGAPPKGKAGALAGVAKTFIMELLDERAIEPSEIKNTAERIHDVLEQHNTLATANQKDVDTLKTETIALLHEHIRKP